MAAGNFVGEFQTRTFERAVRLARQFEVDAQLLRLGFNQGRLLLDLVEFGAQCLVGRARLVEHAGEAGGLRFFLLERTQRCVERLDDLVEGFLELVEFADLAAGVGQQVAQNLVFLAHARAVVGEIPDGGVIAVAISTPGAGLATPAAEQFRQLYKATYTELRYYIPLRIETHAAHRCAPHRR
jgi:hypothetical protein